MNQPQVVRPFPFEIRCIPEPSIFMTYSWSHPVFLSMLSFRWKMMRFPSAEKYASALFPPKVIWRMLVR
jgi:hypothetical protein